MEYRKNIVKDLPKELNQIIRIIKKRKKGYQYNQRLLKIFISKLIDDYLKYDNIYFHHQQINLFRYIFDMQKKRSKYKFLKEHKIHKSEFTKSIKRRIVKLA